MNAGWPAIYASMLVVCACNAQPKPPTNNEAPQPANMSIAPERTANAAEVTNEKPLSEPTGPIDPKSAEGAAQVVQQYGALIEQDRNAEAARLWSDPAVGKKVRDKLAAPDVHLEVGKPSDPEGAAGSVYVTVPVVFYGHMVSQEPYRHTANLVLRRVNDVPGSTEEQRRWHIERIEWVTWSGRPSESCSTSPCWLDSAG